MAIIMSAVPKWERLDKEYLYSDWTFDTNILMTGGQGGDIYARKNIFDFLRNYKLSKNE